MRLFAPASSSISYLGYDPKGRTLIIAFTNGGCWRYSLVPVDIARQLATAESVGKAYRDTIRGHYPGGRLTPEEEGKFYRAVELAEHAALLKREIQTIQTRIQQLLAR